MELSLHRTAHGLHMDCTRTAQDRTRTAHGMHFHSTGPHKDCTWNALSQHRTAHGLHGLHFSLHRAAHGLHGPHFHCTGPHVELSLHRDGLQTLTKSDAALPECSKDTLLPRSRQRAPFSPTHAQWVHSLPHLEDQIRKCHALSADGVHHKHKYVRIHCNWAQPA